MLEYAFFVASGSLAIETVCFEWIFILGSACAGSIIQEDRILQAMPNIVMALHVLCERMTNDSLWKPYLSILPSVLLSWHETTKDLGLLKGKNNFRVGFS